jgi:hypothetical protein
MAISRTFNEVIQVILSRLTVDTITGCWNWPEDAYCDKDGYGSIRYAGRRMRVHRLMYIHAFGDVPEEMCVCHHCDNRKCENPEHFFLGTIADNIGDMYSKGRGASPEKRSKLTREQAFTIKLASGFQKDIGKVYGIAQTTVSQIKLGKHWRSLQEVCHVS